MRVEEINGRMFNVDDAAFKSWAAFEHIAIFSDENKTPFERTNAMFALLEVATDLKKQDIIELAGGESASVQDVLDILAKAVAKAAPKN